jgi:DNA-directed RNA polymerase specialized sigma subunit
VDRRKRNLSPLTAERQQLAERYMPLAESLVAGFRHPRCVDDDELRDAAYAALVDCARTFDPYFGVNFATFARCRIRGSLRDANRFVRRANWRGKIPPNFVELKRAACVIDRKAPDPQQQIADADEVECLLGTFPCEQGAALRSIYLDGRKTRDVLAAFDIAPGVYYRSLAAARASSAVPEMGIIGTARRIVGFR